MIVFRWIYENPECGAVLGDLGINFASEISTVSNTCLYDPKGPSTQISGIYPRPYLRFLTPKSDIPLMGASKISGPNIDPK